MFSNDFVRLYTFIFRREGVEIFLFFKGYFFQFTFFHFHLTLLFIVYLIIFCIVKCLGFFLRSAVVW